jgi:hypothetical protein
MTLSGAAAQAAAWCRDAPPQAKNAAGSAAMMSVVMMMMVVAVVMPVTVPAGRLAAHGDTAGLAELRRLRFHAGRDSGDVGDDVGAKPHRIGRARLAGGIAALGRRTIETSKQQGEQDDGAGQVNNPHLYPLGLAILFARVKLPTK